MIKGLSERLHYMRMKLKLSQKQVAERLGLSASVVSGYETGERTPSVEQLLALACLYNCSADYLLGRQKDIYLMKNNIRELNEEQSRLLANFINSIRLG